MHSFCIVIPFMVSIIYSFLHTNNLTNVLAMPRATERIGGGGDPGQTQNYS